MASSSSGGESAPAAAPSQVRVTISEPVPSDDDIRNKQERDGDGDREWSKRTHRMNSIRKRGYEIVSIKERHGPMRKAIPVMPSPLAGLCCLINCVLPGIGTIISGFSALCGCPTEHETRCRAFAWNLLTGLLQLLTTPLVLVGWIWSIIWGITFLQLIIDAKPASQNGSQQNPGNIDT